MQYERVAALIIQAVPSASATPGRPSAVELLKAALQYSFDDALAHVDQLLQLPHGDVGPDDERRFRLLRTQLGQWQELMSGSGGSEPTNPRRTR